MDFHSLDLIEVKEKLETDETKGLSTSQYIKRSKEKGKNILTDEKKSGIIKKFLSQFKDFMIVILLISAVVSLVSSFISGEHEYFDFFIIIAIVLCNGIIGTIQEYKAEKAIDALKSISSPTATVIRNGKKKMVDSTELVVGDIVILKTGDIVPADIRITQSVELSCEESSLTGESVPVSKNENVICELNAPLPERKNMLYSGCGISSGHARGIVVAIGMNTQIGKIATLLQKEEAPLTPLQKKLNKAGKTLGIAVILICVLIFGLGLLTNIPVLDMLMISVSLAVAAIPEGLTAVVTIVLAMGVKRMVAKKAIIRKLPATETLGGVSVICSDKTGTLTQNKMTVVSVCNLNEELPLNSEERKLILGLSSLCNNAEISKDNKSFGMPTELALIKAAGSIRNDFVSQFPRVGEIPFSSQRKIMSTVHKSGDGYVVITKGAPDYIIKLCSSIMVKGNVATIGKTHIDKIEKLNKAMAEKALRVLAVAKKETDKLGEDDNEIESGLCFCGLIGIEDPPRKEAKKAVEQCKKAGITPVMITGDQVLTALAIAERVGIYNDNYKYMTGSELSTLSVKSLAEIIDGYRVFARVTPEDKVKIVRAFQLRGELIAMTGDGVNDAPALKAADIGCAMGKSGTEVAKSAADMVLTDDNFATIVEAVKEGRGIYSNIRKTIHFLLSCNTGEILVILGAFLMGLPVPLSATQILWVNLVTDSFPALALGASKVSDSVMETEFEESKKGIFSKDICFSMILEGAFIGVMSLLAFIIGRNYFDINPNNPIIARTMCFAVLCLSQLVHSFNVSEATSVFSTKKTGNKWLNYSFILCSVLLIIVIVVPSFALAFKITTLNAVQWLIVASLSAIPLLVAEVEKLTDKIILKRKH